MSYLSKITAIPLKKPQKPSAAEQRRAKLVTALEEQLAMASAAAEGREHAVTKQVWRRDEQGNRVRVEREKHVRAWFWRDGDAVSMTIRYGSQPVELAKGKRALSVPTLAALPDAICTIIAAVHGGELDAAIEAVAGKPAANAKKPA